MPCLRMLAGKLPRGSYPQHQRVATRRLGWSTHKHATHTAHACLLEQQSVALAAVLPLEAEVGALREVGGARLGAEDERDVLVHLLRVGGGDGARVALVL